MRQGEVAQTVTEVLDALGQKFGATGAHLWEVIVRQQVVEAWMYTGLGLFLLAICALLFSVAWAFRHDEDGARDAAGVGILVLALAALPLTSGFGRHMNPEYYALKEVTAMLRGGQ